MSYLISLLLIFMVFSLHADNLINGKSTDNDHNTVIETSAPKNAVPHNNGTNGLLKNTFIEPIDNFKRIKAKPTVHNEIINTNIEKKSSIDTSTSKILDSNAIEPSIESKPNAYVESELKKEKIDSTIKVEPNANVEEVKALKDETIDSIIKVEPTANAAEVKTLKNETIDATIKVEPTANTAEVKTLNKEIVESTLKFKTTPDGENVKALKKDIIKANSSIKPASNNQKNSTSNNIKGSTKTNTIIERETSGAQQKDIIDANVDSTLPILEKSQ